MKKKSRAWIISAAMTIILALLTVNAYLQLTQETLPPSWGGFVIAVSLTMLFGVLLLVSIISAFLTLIYAAGFYKLGLAISVIISAITLLTLPSLILLMLPHVIAGALGVR